MRLQVSVGILLKPNQTTLIQERRQGTDCAGYWEFPGGKIKALETPKDALVRELKEELNITILDVEQLVQLDYDYSHVQVRLYTFLIRHWAGQAQGKEGQKIVWVTPEQAKSYQLLAAAYPLLDAIAAK